MCISLCILRQMALSVLDGESVSIWLFVYPSITCNISDSTHWSLINVTEWCLLWCGSFTNALITERDILILSGGTHAISKRKICHSCGNECLTAVTLSTYISEDAHPGYKASKFQIWQTFILMAFYLRSFLPPFLLHRGVLSDSALHPTCIMTQVQRVLTFSTVNVLCVGFCKFDELCIFVRGLWTIVSGTLCS